MAYSLVSRPPKQTDTQPNARAQRTVPRVRTAAWTVIKRLDATEAIDFRMGINRFARPDVGEAYSIVREKSNDNWPKGGAHGPSIGEP